MNFITTVLSALLLMSGFSLAQEKMEALTLTDGRSFTGVTITKFQPDAIRIMHSDGIAVIPFEKLPAEFQEKYGFDAEKAAAFRSEQAGLRRDQSVRSALAQQREAAARQRAKEQEKIQASVVPMSFVVMQVTDGGALVNNVIERVVTSGGNRNGNGGSVVARTSKTPGEKVYFVTGWVGADLAEDTMISGDFAEDGTYTYIDTDDASRTVKKYRFYPKK